MYTLNVESRTKETTAQSLAKAGRIPAVMYGPKQPSTSISVATADFIKVFKKAGESSVVTVKLGNEEHDALIHDMDIHPVTDAPRHIDFYIIEKGKKVQVDVPIVFEGVAPAVKDLQGILVKVLRELKIEAAPKDLPHDIKVDISPLVEFSSVILAKDVQLPAGVILIEKPDEVVASIAQAKEEPTEVPTLDMSAIEVEKKGKEAKEGAEGEAGAADAAAGDKK